MKEIEKITLFYEISNALNESLDLDKSLYNVLNIFSESMGMVRGTVSLPNGTGKTVRILVLTKGDNVKKAEKAGADHAGLEEYVETDGSGK